jgi:hypothetical protein
MNIAAQTIDYKTAKHARLVSFENSNSWLDLLRKSNKVVQ